MNNQVGFEPVEPHQPEGIKIAKATFYLFLSFLKGMVQSFLLLIWVIVGLILATNAVPEFAGLRDFVLSAQILIFLAVLVYETIVNFKRIKK